MRTTAIAAVGVLATAASIGLAAPASTDVLNQFSQPGGNVNCVMGTENGGQYYAAAKSTSSAINRRHGRARAPAGVTYSGSTKAIRHT